MKIFVAGKVGEENLVRKAMDLIKQGGHTITFDWTRIPHLKPYDQNMEESKNAAILESQGLLEADALVLLAHEKGIGMYVELGMAIASQKPVYVVGTVNSPTMFLHHPVVKRVKNINQVLDLLSMPDFDVIKS